MRKLERKMKMEAKKELKTEHAKGEMIIYKGKFLEYFHNDGTQIRVAEIAMPWRPDSLKDAQDVLHRWNSHNDLLDACKEYIKHFDSDESNSTMNRWLDAKGIPAMREAISQAEIK